MESRKYTVLVHPDEEDGGFYTTVPAIPGVVGQGETVEEALEDVRASLSFTLESMLEDGEEIPPDAPVEAVRTLELGPISVS
jgi:antitoxin HicB